MPKKFVIKPDMSSDWDDNWEQTDTCPVCGENFWQNDSETLDDFEYVDDGATETMVCSSCKSEFILFYGLRLEGMMRTKLVGDDEDGE